MPFVESIVTESNIYDSITNVSTGLVLDLSELSPESKVHCFVNHGAESQIWFLKEYVMTVQDRIYDSRDRMLNRVSRLFGRDDAFVKS